MTGACLAATAAQAECTISDDAALYAARKEQAIVLLQYGDTVVRATGGKIRCEEDTQNRRQVCRIDGQGEMLVDTGADRLTIRLTGPEMNEVHLSKAGETTCQS